MGIGPRFVAVFVVGWRHLLFTHDCCSVLLASQVGFVRFVLSFFRSVSSSLFLTFFRSLLNIKYFVNVDGGTKGANARAFLCICRIARMLCFRHFTNMDWSLQTGHGNAKNK